MDGALDAFLETLKRRNPGETRDQPYGFRDLQQELGVVRGAKVPRTTLLKWMEVCNVPFRKRRGCYSAYELKKLGALCLHLSKYRSYKQFQEEYNAHLRRYYEGKKKRDEERNSEPIEVNCIRV